MAVYHQITLIVTPAKAGVQIDCISPGHWIPAFAGMTKKMKLLGRVGMTFTHSSVLIYIYQTKDLS